MSNEAQKLEIRAVPQTAGQSPDVEQRLDAGTLNALFSNRILRALTASAVLATASACGSPDEQDYQVDESPNITATAANPQKQYPFLMMEENPGKENPGGELTSIGPALFNAKRDYTLVFEIKDNPTAQCTFNTKIDDRGFDSHICDFKRPISSLQVTASYVNESGETVEVPLKGLCEGETDGCIRGFRSYPE